MTASHGRDIHTRAAATPPGELVARLRAAGCVFAEEEARVLVTSARSPAELTALLAARIEGVPLEHVVGWVSFCGLRIHVRRGVFVPRRRTEALAREAIASVRPGAVVLDLCCGCGALGAAVRAAVPDVELHAADIDPPAVACTRQNIGAGRAYCGDLYAPLPGSLRGRVDVLVANAPYVPSGSIALMPPEAREHEPLAALDGGPDGLDLQRRVIAGAGDWLAPGGRLLIETSERQASGTAAEFVRHGLTPRIVHSAEHDGTVVAGTPSR
ncbi:putative protein N(5)-glutamine methyltransferase [Speluncibacter jeojiensis]|uniref:putative protein N(5)-glutamine methyltransferase n=1 Tax=Speluncibacter jeojiensis TaxID=2710754 RepID=UPI00240FAB34|nr:putative protein N(5)-glutamine methyltransferase [Rhodococcus sp. D2-41]